MDEKELDKIPDNFERKEDLKKAIAEFLLKERFILEKELNERTLTHKLAEYIQKYFSDYNVDCEYNRMLSEDANKDYITKKLNLKINKVNTTDTSAKTVYPDIIIHKRGNDKNNLLIIEMKKKINSRDKNFDLNKINGYINERNYLNGLYLELNKDKVSDLEWT